MSNSGVSASSALFSNPFNESIVRLLNLNVRGTKNRAINRNEVETMSWKAAVATTLLEGTLDLFAPINSTNAPSPGSTGAFRLLLQRDENLLQRILTLAVELKNLPPNEYPKMRIEIKKMILEIIPILTSGPLDFDDQTALKIDEFISKTQARIRELKNINFHTIGYTTPSYVKYLQEITKRQEELARISTEIQQKTKILQSLDLRLSRKMAFEATYDQDIQNILSFHEIIGNLCIKQEVLKRVINQHLLDEETLINLASNEYGCTFRQIQFLANATENQTNPSNTVVICKIEMPQEIQGLRREYSDISRTITSNEIINGVNQKFPASTVKKCILAGENLLAGHLEHYMAFSTEISSRAETRGRVNPSSSEVTLGNINSILIQRFSNRTFEKIDQSNMTLETQILFSNLANEHRNINFLFERQKRVFAVYSRTRIDLGNAIQNLLQHNTTQTLPSLQINDIALTYEKKIKEAVAIGLEGHHKIDLYDPNTFSDTIEALKTALFIRFMSLKCSSGQVFFY